MNKPHLKPLINRILDDIDIPDSAYEKAENRYGSLGDWLSREESSLVQMDPHIFPQGSFRLGTVIKPIDCDHDFDLDLGCKLRKGISKETQTQYDVKKLIQKELEAYRQSYHIDEKLEEKKRCWCLNYKGQPNFHMDIVPCIPERELRIKNIHQSIFEAGETDRNAIRFALSTVDITDNTHKNYQLISDDWPLSNPEGYAGWFEFKMASQKGLFEAHADTQVDDIPSNTRRTILQKCIQLLKRHRDVFFQNNKDSKIISIILTTLAAKAYNGEPDLIKALMHILNNMETLIRSTTPRIPNPVNPKEDFADKWNTAKGRDLQLEENTKQWIKAAKTDITTLANIENAYELQKKVKVLFALDIPDDFAQSLIPAPLYTPPHKIKTNTPSPWLNSDEDTRQIH
jgi:hypothetical protein